MVSAKDATGTKSVDAVAVRPRTLSDTTVSTWRVATSSVAVTVILRPANPTPSGTVLGARLSVIAVEDSSASVTVTSTSSAVTP